jgi:hypothetical protein
VNVLLIIRHRIVNRHSLRLLAVKGNLLGCQSCLPGLIGKYEYLLGFGPPARGGIVAASFEAGKHVFPTRVGRPSGVLEINGRIAVRPFATSRLGTVVSLHCQQKPCREMGE